MNRILKHILPLLTVIFFASCSDKDEAKVISRRKMADIYAEMLMTDQWINSTPNVRKIADTSLVYEPILEKYGYSQKDYLKSVDHYMNDPERFARILRSSGEKLGRKLKELRRRQKQLELEEETKKKVLRHQTDFSFEDYFPYMGDEPYVHYYDSLTFETDSFRVYRLKPIERADTLYDRIRMIIRDSLAVDDTLAQADSLALADSLAVTDSITVADSLAVEMGTMTQHSSIRIDDGRPVLKSNRKWQVKE